MRFTRNIVSAAVCVIVATIAGVMIGGCDRPPEEGYAPPEEIEVVQQAACSGGMPPGWFDCSNDPAGLIFPGETLFFAQPACVGGNNGSGPRFCRGVFVPPGQWPPATHTVSNLANWCFLDNVIKSVQTFDVRHAFAFEHPNFGGQSHDHNVVNGCGPPFTLEYGFGVTSLHVSN